LTKIIQKTCKLWYNLRVDVTFGSFDEMTKPKATREMVHRSLQKLPVDGHEHEDCIRNALDSGFDDEHFYVGDEVISGCGSIAGVILSITGDEALISWSCRGKSIEPVSGLVHVEHQVT
jgi:hypothetical protein